MIDKFADDSEITENQINGIPYTYDDNDQIILDSTLGYITCKVSESISSGDHTLYLCKVINQKMMGEGEPLTTQSVGKQYV